MSRVILEAWVRWYDSKWEDREFVPPIDETRAALSEPAPEPIGYVIRMTGNYHTGGFCAEIFCDKILSPQQKLYAAPPPASPSDARDAARYQKLRDVGVYLSERLLFKDELDEVVDGFIKAAIEREGKRDWLRGIPSADFPEGE